MPEQDYFELVCLLRKDGCAAGYIEPVDVKFFPDIDDLSSAWAEVCHDILREIKEFYLEVSRKEKTVSADSIIGRTMRSACLCCQYAGIGAVYFWDQDSDELEENGIFETLTEPNGLMEMDEFIVEEIGLPFQSSEEQKLRKHLNDNINRMYDIIGKSSDQKKQAIECLHALYLYGIQLGMVMLGI